jgi:hypothetical protein
MTAFTAIRETNVLGKLATSIVSLIQSYWMTMKMEAGSFSENLVPMYEHARYHTIEA